jgi:hypothetical protein
MGRFRADPALSQLLDNANSLIRRKNSLLIRWNREFWGGAAARDSIVPLDR